MSLLKSIAGNIYKENEIKKKKSRQFANNPMSHKFEVAFPIIEKIFPDEDLMKRLAAACRSIGDVQNRETNARASMTDWWMHETNSDFKKVCDIAIELALENSPSQVPLMPYDCWGVTYNKGDHTISHDHWPQIWSWVYNVECCIECASLIIDDTFQSPLFSYEVLPKKGNMIMFPGWVNHSVPKHESKDDRVVIAGNLSWKLPKGQQNDK